MARIHARTRGRSKSRRPLATEAPSWQGPSKNEVKDLVVKLSKEGNSSADIGRILRDVHSVPNVKLATGQSVTEILKAKGVTFKLPEDLANLIHRVINLDEHLKEKPQDLHNKRALALTESKIRRLAKYYKRTGALSPDWTYSIKNVKLLVE